MDIREALEEDEPDSTYKSNTKHPLIALDDTPKTAAEQHDHGISVSTASNPYLGPFGMYMEDAALLDYLQALHFPSDESSQSGTEYDDFWHEQDPKRGSPLNKTKAKNDQPVASIVVENIHPKQELSVAFEQARQLMSKHDSDLPSNQQKQQRQGQNPDHPPRKPSRFRDMRRQPNETGSKHKHSVFI